MGAVVEAIVQPVKEVAKAAETVVKPIVQAVQEVGKAVEQTAQAVAKDPLPVLISIAATPVLGPAAAAIGLPSAAVAPLTAAAISAAQGNSIEEVAKSAAASFVGGQVAGKVAGALPTDIAQVVKDIVPSAATGATVAAITGQDPLLAALGSGVAGGVAGQVAPELGSTAGTVAGQTAGAVATGRDLEQALGSSLSGVALSELGKAAQGAIRDIQAPAPTQVAQEQTMDEVLAQMIQEEMAAPSTPSPFAPIAAGGVASDFAPTPLVPSPIGTVTVTSPPVDIQGEGIAFEDLPPIEDDFVAEAPMPSPVAPQPTLPISQQDQQIFDLLQQITAQQPTAATAPAPSPAPTPEIVPMPEIEQEQPAAEPVAPEAPAEAPVAQQPTPPISAGPVEQPMPEVPQMPTMGGGGISPQDQELLDLITAIEGGQGAQPSAPSGTGVSGESMGVVEAPTFEEEEETELVDTGPREPGEQLPAEGGVSTVTVMGPAATPVRTRRAGFAPSDSTLSALLGTSLSEGAAEPIMGEDEGKRRAVWNIESLRNALGI